MKNRTLEVAKRFPMDVSFKGGVVLRRQQRCGGNLQPVHRADQADGPVPGPVVPIATGTRPAEELCSPTPPLRIAPVAKVQIRVGLAAVDALHDALPSRDDRPFCAFAFRALRGSTDTRQARRVDGRSRCLGVDVPHRKLRTSHGGSGQRIMGPRGASMRVAFVAPYFYPFTGGVETASWETAKALVQDHGVEVEVHTSWHTGPAATMPPGPTSYFDGGLTVHRYRSPKQVVFFMPKISESCDLLHVLGFHRLLAPVALFGARHRVAVLQPYGNLSQVPGEPSGALRSLRLEADKTVSKWFVSKFSAVLCLDERERQAMVRAGAQRESTRLLKAPVPLYSSDNTTSGATVSRDGSVFLYVARVTRLKYIEHAIMALAHVPRARLAVVGPLVDETYHRALVSLARDIGVEGRVSFLGEIPAAELHARYRESAGLVLCSRNEGQGLVLAEAAANGSVPIVARGASDELIAAMGCGLSYPWGDPVGLAQCLEQVMDHRASFEPALASARTFVETELAPSVVAAKLLGIYGELGAGA